MKCEVHKECPESACAKVGLPGPNGVWVCNKGFDEFQRRETSDWIIDVERAKGIR